MITQIIFTLALGIILGILFGLVTEEVSSGIYGFFVGGLTGFALSLCIAMCIPANTIEEVTTKNIIPLSQIMEIKDDKYIICDKNENNLIYTFYIKNKQGYPEKVSLVGADLDITPSKIEYKYTNTEYKMVNPWCWGYRIDSPKHQIIASETSIYYTFVKE